jgi:HSP20 family protein
MQLVKFNPFTELTGIDQLFNDTFDRFFENTDRRLTNKTWSPSVDVSETETEILFTAELPGFEKDGIDISVNDGRLSISGERQFTEEKEAKHHRVERWYGKFYRSFLLPKSADAEKISANLKNGVLTVTLPKKEEAKPRQIPVSVN